MKTVTFNRTHISGLFYQHKLEAKVSGANSKNPGTPFIAGTVDIATDDALTNIVTVHFTYQTELTSKGKPNRTYTILKGILDGTYKSVMAHGKDNATLFSIDSAIGLNEFYSDRSGQEELVSTKRNEGGFINVVTEVEEDETLRNTFDTDIIVYNVKHVEADPEKNLPEKAIVCGYIFDFRQAFLPVEFSVLNPNAIAYFEGLDASKKNPVFTRVRGSQVSVISINRVEEANAFGEAYVREYSNTRKDFIITWAKREPYSIEEDGDITPAEITKGLAERETALAAIKKRQDEYNATKNAAPSAFSPVVNPSNETFNF